MGLAQGRFGGTRKRAALEGVSDAVVLQKSKPDSRFAENSPTLSAVPYKLPTLYAMLSNVSRPVVSGMMIKFSVIKGQGTGVPHHVVPFYPDRASPPTLLPRRDKFRR